MELNTITIMSGRLLLFIYVSFYQLEIYIYIIYYEQKVAKYARIAERNGLQFAPAVFSQTQTGQVYGPFIS